jgi:hypothetical protein
MDRFFLGREATWCGSLRSDSPSLMLLVPGNVWHLHDRLEPFSQSRAGDVLQCTVPRTPTPLRSDSHEMLELVSGASQEVATLFTACARLGFRNEAMLEVLTHQALATDYRFKPLELSSESSQFWGSWGFWVFGVLGFWGWHQRSSLKEIALAANPCSASMQCVEGTVGRTGHLK